MVYDEIGKLLRSNSSSGGTSGSARVVLAPGAPRKAHRWTGLYGQIRRTVAVEVDFGQSFE
jgi:hypothetical protein